MNSYRVWNHYTTSYYLFTLTRPLWDATGTMIKSVPHVCFYLERIYIPILGQSYHILALPSYGIVQGRVNMEDHTAFGEIFTSWRLPLLHITINLTFCITFICRFGSLVVGNRTGIIFNNQMDDFSTPNTVNTYGIPASASNFIAPGKMPMSSMSPSIVLDQEGNAVHITGASGGPAIISAITHVSVSVSATTDRWCTVNPIWNQPGKFTLLL